MILDATHQTIGQVRQYGRRGKSWRLDGTVFSNSYIPQWSVDLGIFYPDQTMYDINLQQLLVYRPSRKTLNNWNFRVWDHPGINDIYYHYFLDGNYVDVGLYYANFACDFYDEQGPVAPQVGFAVKILLRHDTGGTCTWEYDGNSAWVWQHINIPDWPNPPNGTQLP